MDVLATGIAQRAGLLRPGGLRHDLHEVVGACFERRGEGEGAVRGDFEDPLGVRQHEPGALEAEDADLELVGSRDLFILVVGRLALAASTCNQPCAQQNRGHAAPQFDQRLTSHVPAPLTSHHRHTESAGSWAHRAGAGRDGIDHANAGCDPRG